MTAAAKHPDVRAVLTDFGAVVIDIPIDEGLAHLAAAAGDSLDHVRDVIYHQRDYWRDMHRGALHELDYFRRELKPVWPALSEGDFITAWRAMIGEDFPEVREAYFALPPDVPLYTLSNIGPLHKEFLRDHWLLERSKGFFATCDLGLVKPDADSFQYALQQIGEPAENVLFFDDRDENTLAAEALGIQTVLVTDPALVPQALRARNLLSE